VCHLPDEVGSRAVRVAINYTHFVHTKSLSRDRTDIVLPHIQSHHQSERIDLDDTIVAPSVQYTVLGRGDGPSRNSISARTHKMRWNSAGLR
jgi:hypothetical protein